MRFFINLIKKTRVYISDLTYENSFIFLPSGQLNDTKMSIFLFIFLFLKKGWGWGWGREGKRRERVIKY
jgi:hypothetical protein